jgi:hypothetical protein
MKAFDKSLNALTSRLASSFSLTEKSAAHSETRDACEPPCNWPDEHNRTDILTSGLNLAPAFPVVFKPVA